MIPYYLLRRRVIGLPSAGGGYRYGTVTGAGRLGNDAILYVIWEGTHPTQSKHKPAKWFDTVPAVGVVEASGQAAA